MNFITPAEMLIQLKDRRKLELKQQCEEITYTGKVFNYTDINNTETTIYLGGGEAVVVLLQNKALACKSENINYIISDVITNDLHTMSADEGLRLSNECMVWGSSQWEKKKTKQNLVDATTTMEEALNITWDSVE